MKLLHRLTAWLGRKSRARERRRLHLELIEVGRSRTQQKARTVAIMNRLFALSLHGDKESAESLISGSELPWPGLPAEGLRVVREGEQ